MARTKKSKAPYYVGGGIAVAGLVGALLFLGGDAKAEAPKEQDPEPPKPDPQDPEPEPEPEPKPDIVPAPGNWGVTPPKLREAFAKTEKAAGIPGLGRFLAIWSWGAFRAKKPPVGAEEAAKLAAEHPELCRLCHNQSESERKASQAALDRVTKPKSEGGAYDKPWPTPDDYGGWTDGSYGLFDILAGSHAHAGYHDGHFAPLIDQPAAILFEVDVQCYVAGVMVSRIVKNPNLLVLVDDDPLESWANIRACTSTPQGFIDLTKGKATNGAKVAQQAKDNFFMRAIEIGIDAASLEMPFNKKADIPWAWPGAPAFFNALGVKL